MALDDIIRPFSDNLDTEILKPINRADSIKADAAIPDLQGTLEKLSYNPDNVDSKYDKAVKATIDFLNGKSSDKPGATTGAGSGGDPTGGGTPGATKDTLKKNWGSGTGPVDKPGEGHKWTMAKDTSCFGGSKECQGVSGPYPNTCTMNKKGPFYFASSAGWHGNGSSESLLPARFKKIKFGQKLIFRYKGKCAIAVYADHGPNISTGRWMDLGQNIADYLGLPGTGDVEVDFVNDKDVAASTVTGDAAAGGTSTGNGAKMVAWAKKWIGKNGYTQSYGGYRFGQGVSRGDCSAFVNAAVHAVTRKYIGGADSYTVSQTDWFKRKKMWISGRSAWKQAAPGDCVYYSGHVALFIGDGKVISNGSDPIKYHKANYRTVLGVGQSSKM
jgi:hypothetical protein